MDSTTHTQLRQSADGPYDKLGDVAHRHVLFLEQHDGVLTVPHG